MDGGGSDIHPLVRHRGYTNHDSKSKRGQNGIISALACSPDPNSGLYAAGSFAGSIGLYDLRAGASRDEGQTVAEIVEAHDGRGITAMKIRCV